MDTQTIAQIKKELKEEIYQEIYEEIYEDFNARLEPLEYSFENFGDKLELILEKILEKNSEGKEKKMIDTTRLMFNRKYLGDNVHITFTDGKDTYQYPHDELLQSLSKNLDIIVDTQSWQERGVYHFPRLSKEIKKIMEQYKK